MGESLALRWASVCSVGRESAQIVSAMYVERDSAWTALVALGTTRLPHTVGKTRVETPECQVQMAPLVSDGLAGAMSLHPISGRLDRQSQGRPYRRQVQPFVVHYHPWCFCDPFIVISSLLLKYRARVLLEQRVRKYHRSYVGGTLGRHSQRSRKTA